MTNDFANVKKLKEICPEDYESAWDIMVCNINKGLHRIKDIDTSTDSGMELYEKLLDHECDIVEWDFEERIPVFYIDVEDAIYDWVIKEEELDIARRKEIDANKPWNRRKDHEHD